MISLLLALALAQTAPVQTASASSSAVAGWSFRESSDPAKPKSATALIRSTDGNTRLVVRCDTADHPIISVQFLTKPPMTAGDPRSVQVTLDSGMAEISTWQFPGQGAYNGEAVEVFMIVDGISKAKAIDVATDDGAGNPVSGHFAGPGGDDMFRKVYAACGLPYAMPSATPAPKK
ncbi:MAG: hypothetical protein ABW023_10275 [Sphingomonas sp.]